MGAHQSAEHYALQRFSLVVVAWRSGLRAAELLDLDERDLNPERHSVTVRNGKRGKRRTAKMDPWACKQIQPYLEFRAGLPVGKLFCSLRTGEQGQQVSTDRLGQLCAELGRRANLRRRVHPHQFRHTHAVGLYRAGVPLFWIMVQSGHSHLGVTQLYLRSLGADALLEQNTEMPQPRIALDLALGL